MNAEKLIELLSQAQKDRQVMVELASGWHVIDHVAIEHGHVLIVLKGA